MPKYKTLARLWPTVYPHLFVAASLRPYRDVWWVDPTGTPINHRPVGTFDDE